MENYEENRGVVGDIYLCNGDQGMQIVWDHLYRYSVVITSLKGKMQTRFAHHQCQI